MDKFLGDGMIEFDGQDHPAIFKRAGFNAIDVDVGFGQNGCHCGNDKLLIFIDENERSQISCKTDFRPVDIGDDHGSAADGATGNEKGLTLGIMEFDNHRVGVQRRVFKGEKSIRDVCFFG